MCLDNKSLIKTSQASAGIGWHGEWGEAFALGIRIQFLPCCELNGMLPPAECRGSGTGVGGGDLGSVPSSTMAHGGHFPFLRFCFSPHSVSCPRGQGRSLTMCLWAAPLQPQIATMGPESALNQRNVRLAGTREVTKPSSHVGKG